MEYVAAAIESAPGLIVIKVRSLETDRTSDAALAHAVSLANRFSLV